MNKRGNQLECNAFLKCNGIITMSRFDEIETISAVVVGAFDAYKGWYPLVDMQIRKSIRVL